MYIVATNSHNLKYMQQCLVVAASYLCFYFLSLISDSECLWEDDDKSKETHLQPLTFS